MKPVTREVRAKSVLSKTGIPGADYCLNPYIGCSHGCRYCYASFMKRYTGHAEPWGTFVDAKVNAPEVLRKQLTRAKKGNIFISSVTDPYQPLDREYRLTRRCLGELTGSGFSIDILTKSPLVLRDIDLFKTIGELDVGLTITTDDDGIRKIFEPNAPPIEARIKALKTLHREGIRTYVFIGPVLPMSPEILCEKILPYAADVLIDRMNYTSKTAALYRKFGIEEWLEDEFVEDLLEKLKEASGGRIV